MSSNPIKIILNSSNWDDFEKSLYNLGNSPENKKIKVMLLNTLQSFLELHYLFSLNLKKIYHHSELPLSIP